MWQKIEKRLPIKKFLTQHIRSYMVPASLNIWYVFGLLALFFILMQFVSGFWMLMFYVPTVKEAFSSVQSLMHQVPAGWFIRYLHTTGASFLFIVLYLHVFRGFLYGSYQKPRELVWMLGVFLWLLMMIEAFMGYVLPWGQMSFWGAQVVTSALDGIPVIGPSLKYWLRGAHEVGQPILQRFYAFHIVLVPFLLFLIIKLHIIAIRYVGSSEPIETLKPAKKIPFYPDHLLKEAVPVSLVFTLFFMVLFFWPSLGGVFIEDLNQEPANSFVTPSAIHPPWYITPFFAILRAIPNLTFGILVTILSFILFFLLPLLDKSQHRVLFCKTKLFRYMVYLFCIDFVFLGILGWFEVNELRLMLARILITIYFAFFLLMPIYSRQKVWI
jgi:ubiquinol-cytochrome c reductase cytochrome b subunit